MVAVVAAAVALPRGPAAVSALISVTALNFCFVPPRGSLTVDGAEYWWILLALLGLALGLGALLGSLRGKREEAELATKRASELHRLSEAMADAEGLPAMATAAATHLQQATARPCAIYLRDSDGGALMRFSDAPADGFDERAATWAIDNGRVLGAGSLDWPELPIWCVPFSRARSAGCVQMVMARRERVTAAQAEHWTALARQAGMVLERERASAAASRAEQSAKAEAARSTLLASLSHDLRTPLAGIVGSASALRSQGAELTESQRLKLLESLEDEARDLALMADNILQIARLSQPHADLRMQWESVEDILGAAVGRMRRRWPNASIQLKSPHGLPPLRAEASLLAQAVANLVDNAARHGGEPPRVVVQAGRSREGLFVAIRDHGAGLPPGDPSELFARWRRGEASRSGGSGLGLAICQLTAEAHGGAVSAKRCDPGAEFRIDLPVSAAPKETL
jgi:two-component system, OmpR family, sensor histidine kinase KdpD